jgi:hypothetical protein
MRDVRRLVPMRVPGSGACENVLTDNDAEHWSGSNRDGAAAWWPLTSLPRPPRSRNHGVARAATMTDVASLRRARFTGADAAFR